ncbi:Hypothetical protein SRAE_0000078300 [Strongyloides ratti]|uniref:Uncharacterized protein n=1 Tax=Strongyloides ratti TaxID=34506 RepID=A0A090L2I9_STRRB|nr:Hypothetical protein SRAE_0000078300 [Strongyloides ratti]CEF61669.1 Hypothetical protein SRAE_0000078300 [Strongyloides ratti]
MRLALYSFLFLIFAFQYYCFRFPGMGRRHNKLKLHNSNYIQRSNSFSYYRNPLNQRGQIMNPQPSMYQRMNGRKKRDLYEIFKKM